MKEKTKNQALGLNKYDASIILLVAFAIVFILGVWIWFGQKDNQIRKELIEAQSY